MESAILLTSSKYWFKDPIALWLVLRTNTSIPQPILAAVTQPFARKWIMDSFNALIAGLLISLLMHFAEIQLFASVKNLGQITLSNAKIVFKDLKQLWTASVFLIRPSAKRWWTNVASDAFHLSSLTLAGSAKIQIVSMQILTLTNVKSANTLILRMKIVEYALLKIWIVSKKKTKLVLYAGQIMNLIPQRVCVSSWIRIVRFSLTKINA